MTAQVHWDVTRESRERLGEFSDELVRRAVEAALAEGERDRLEVSVVFVSDEALCAMHDRFLGDDSPTDVITFDLSDEGEGPGAELYVSVDAAVRSCGDHGLAVENELLLYVVHGTLHLCGCDDHDVEDRRAMRRAEVRVLHSLGIELDSAKHERT